MQRNAKNEFLNHTEHLKVKCASIHYQDDNNSKDIFLTTHHTLEEYDQFLCDLDFEYDAGYGEQYLFGYIWYNNGTWSERIEYDGAEGWEFKSIPEIPDECFVSEGDGKNG